MPDSKPTVEEIAAFLNALRKSGVTNMFGAVPYLMNEFESLTRTEATKALTNWMKNFKGD